MELEKTPSLPNAHQQVRLGDHEAGAQNWSVAVEYYLRAIEYFKAIQRTMVHYSLIENLQAQIVQCEQAIHFCRSKDRSEQASQAQCSLKLSRAQSIPSLPKPNIPGAPVRRDSLSEFMFPKENQIVQTTPTPTPVKAKKHKKNDSHKIEELQMSCDAGKSHLKSAFDLIERLEEEKKQLLKQREESSKSALAQIERLEEEKKQLLKEREEFSKSLTASQEKDNLDTKLEATI